MHGCSACNSPLNSAKALKTCLGTHEEPCPRYHRTLFLIGDSDKCRSCKTAAQMAEARDKEIVALERRLADSVGGMTRKARRKCEIELAEARAKREEQAYTEAVEDERRRLGFLAWASGGPRGNREREQVRGESPGARQGRKGRRRN